MSNKLSKIKQRIKQKLAERVRYILNNPKQYAKEFGKATAESGYLDKGDKVWKPNATKEWTDEEIDAANKELPIIYDTLDGKASSEYKINSKNIERVKNQIIRCGLSEKEIKTFFSPSFILQMAVVLMIAKEHVFKNEVKPLMDALEPSENEKDQLEILKFYNSTYDLGKAGDELLNPIKPILLDACKREPIVLMEDTLKHKSSNTEALGRLLLAMQQGDLTVNGQTPDDQYPLAEYLMHGGRVKFDLSALSLAEQNQFFELITNNQAKSRAYATHRISGVDASGSPAEIKSGLLGFLSDSIRAMFRSSKHYGINIAIGGPNQINREGRAESLGLYPDESGQWGHLYIHKGRNALLFGIEESKPGQVNARTGKKHSVLGRTNKESAFLAPKINSKALTDLPNALSTREKFNWATVKITPDHLANFKNKCTESDTDYVAIARAPHPKALPASPDRKQRMQAWAQATKEGNRMPKAAKWFSGLLVMTGAAIAVLPIPGIAQLLGGSMMALGLGVITASIGLITRFLFKKPFQSAQERYKKTESKIIKSAVSNSEETVGNESANSYRLMNDSLKVTENIDRNAPTPKSESSQLIDSNGNVSPIKPNHLEGLILSEKEDDTAHCAPSL